VVICLLLVITTGLHAQYLTKKLANFPYISQGKSQWVDLDNDHDLDVVVIGQLNGGTLAAYLFENNAGLFTQHAISLPGFTFGDFSFGDYDMDGDQDVIICGNADGEDRFSAIYRNDGGFNFSEQFTFDGVSVATALWLDFDQDGDLDGFISGNANSSAGSTRTMLLENQGLSFAEVTNSGIPVCTSCVYSVADANGDGYPDLMVAGQPETALYINNGNKTFTKDARSAFELLVTSSKWGDFDHDGDLDVVVSGWDENDQVFASLYENQHNIFVRKADSAIGQIALLQSGALLYDLNNDESLDVLAGGRLQSEHTVVQFSGDGKGKFSGYYEPEVDILGQPSYDAGDFDNDGDLDVSFQGYMTGSGSNSGLSGYFENRLINGLPVTNTKPLPPAVSGFLEKPYRDEIRLQWQAGADNESPAGGLSYNFYVRNASKRIIQPDADPITGYLRSSSTTNGFGRRGYVYNAPEGTLFYAVQSIDGGKEASVFSSEKSIYHFNGPEALKAELIDEDDVKLAWTDLSSIETDYRIERSVSPLSGFSTVSTRPANTATYQDHYAFATETYYYFRVTAYNASHTSPYDSLILMIPARATEVLATSINGSSIHLSWKDNSKYETGFSIERKSPADANFVSIALAAANIQSYDDTGLTPGTTYQYRIRSVSDNGGLVPINNVSATTNYLPQGIDFGITGAEDTGLKFNADDFTAHFTDPNAEDKFMGVAFASLPVQGALYLNGVLLTAGQHIGVGQLPEVEFVPAENYNGDVSFSIIVSDGKDHAAEPSKLTATITPVNDPPAFDIFNGIMYEEDFGEWQISPVAFYIPYEVDESINYSIQLEPSDIVRAEYDKNLNVIKIISEKDKFGTVQFTITADDGHPEFNTYSKTMLLTVLPVDDAPVMTKVEDLTIATADEMPEIEIQITDVDSPVSGYSLQVHTYPTPISSQNVKITEKSTGVFSVKLRLANNPGPVITTVEGTKNATSVSMHFTVTILQITAAEEMEHEKFATYPNPVLDKLNIVLDQSLSDDYEITLFDILGKQMWNTNFSGTTTLLDMTAYPAGLYTLSLKGRRGLTIQRKLLKQ